MATEFFQRIRQQADEAGLLSNEHFTVDGTLIEAWASMKSFSPKTHPGDSPSGGSGRNPHVSFRGQKRKNDTHASKTDPDARLYRKGPCKEARLCYMGHVLMENRNGLAVDSRISVADGTAERRIAAEMVKGVKGLHRITVGCDKGYDTSDFIENLRLLTATPHVAQKLSGSAVDQRTTRHPGYAVSQCIRKRVEEIFGWLKTVGPAKKIHVRGREKVESTFTLATAAYNLVRMRTLGVAVPT